MMCLQIVYSIFTVICLSVLQSESAKILAVFPFPAISHQAVFRPLTQELVRRGHEVTVITTDPAFPKGQAPSNLTEIDLHDLSYEAWINGLMKPVKENEGFIAESIRIGVILGEIMELQFRSNEVKTLLNETKEFDLLLVEACMPAALIFSHLYKAPVIQVSSFGSMIFNNEVMGMPTHPILYPTFTRRRIYNLTVWEKIKEVYTYLLVQYYFGKDERVNTMLRNVFGSDVPTIRELAKNVDMLFLNIHPIWESNIPVPPSVIHIWGIHHRVNKKLPKDLKSFLDTSKNGVIYMSFGTNTMPSSLPKQKILAFVKAFSQLPYDILWKWDKDELPGQTDNIKIGKWFPQSDLLQHPNVKLFITQGGLQSTEEAINAAVPLVGVPIRADQWYNVENYVHFKIGRRIDFETLNVEDIKNTIQDVITDDSYRQNIVKMRSLMRDEPEPALERAMWWTEYVLRHKGAGHLQSPAANLSWAEYYEVPLVSTVLIGLVIACLAVLFTVRYLVKSFSTPLTKVKVN